MLTVAVEKNFQVPVKKSFSSITMFSTVGAANNGRDAASRARQREGVCQAFRSRTDLFAGYSGHAATDLGKILSFNFVIVLC